MVDVTSYALMLFNKNILLNYGFQVDSQGLFTENSRSSSVFTDNSRQSFFFQNANILDLRLSIVLGSCKHKILCS